MAMIETEKNFSKTGLTGAALMLYGIVKFFKPEWADNIPSGIFETGIAIMVMLFRKFSDGKTPKIV